MLAGVGLMDLGGRKGMDDLVLHALGTHGEGALQLGDPLRGDAGLGELVHLKLHHFLFLLDHYGNDLIVKPADFWAASVFCWEAAAKASSSSRVMPHTSQIFSAVVPM